MCQFHIGAGDVLNGPITKRFTWEGYEPVVVRRRAN